MASDTSRTMERLIPRRRESDEVHWPKLLGLAVTALLASNAVTNTCSAIALDWAGVEPLAECEAVREVLVDALTRCKGEP